MKRRVKKVLYNLGFAAVIGLAAIPPMVTLYMLAQDIEVLECLKFKGLVHVKDLIPHTISQP
jgi:hypothetical protein